MIKNMLKFSFFVSTIAFSAGVIVGSRLTMIGLLDKAGLEIKPKKITCKKECKKNALV
jgi:hypothetical protein